MSIGEALAQARSRAGLTLTDVSQRTRIRETIIAGIEADDYSACGGDFYARGHIRAIARVAGIDSVPLIEEYDAARRPPEETDDSAEFADPPARRRTGPAKDQGGDPEAGGPADEGSRGGWGSWLGRGDRDGPRRRRGEMLTIWVVLAAVIGFAIYAFVFAAGHRASASGPHQAHPSLQAAGRARSRTPHPSASPKTAPTTTPAAVALRPASARAFGIGGGAGDNSTLAPLAIDNRPATAWQTDWYASARFGNLYSGTGLLVDMGHPVTITAARVTLGPARGTDLSLRVGNTPTLAGLRTTATATNAAGLVSLTPGTPAHGRYVLIWLTSLPRDSAGTFAASIYNIQLSGQP